MYVPVIVVSFACVRVERMRRVYIVYVYTMKERECDIEILEPCCMLHMY